MKSLCSAWPRDEATVGVMIVDDVAVFRRVARAVVDATEGFLTLGDAASGADALARAEQLHPDLVLMDVQMPEMNGFEAARRLRATHPQSIIFLISLEDTEGFEPAVAACGASAFVRKQDLSPRMLRRLWTIHAPQR